MTATVRPPRASAAVCAAVSMPAASPETTVNPLSTRCSAITPAFLVPSCVALRAPTTATARASAGVRFPATNTIGGRSWTARRFGGIVGLEHRDEVHPSALQRSRSARAWARSPSAVRGGSPARAAGASVEQARLRGRRHGSGELFLEHGGGAAPLLDQLRVLNPRPLARPEQGHHRSALGRQQSPASVACPTDALGRLVSRPAGTALPAGRLLPAPAGCVASTCVRLAYELLVRLVFVAASSRSEVPDSLPERAPGLRQSLGTEHKQRDNEDQEQVRGLKDVVDEWHRHKLTRCLAPVTGLFADRWPYG